MKPEHIAKIAGEAAAKIAAEKAIEMYEQQKVIEAEQRADRRLRNTKLLLKNYRSFVAHVNQSIYNTESANEESAALIIELMDVQGESISVESIKRSTARTAIIVAHIENMLLIYKTMCNISDMPEDNRRYRIIHALYIDETPVNILDLAESESIVPRTIYRDRDIAVERLAALFFGIDGMQKARS